MVPYAVEVDGHIITLFDPVVHRAVPFDDDMLDPRWVVCERPCITVGGELSARCWNCGWTSRRACSSRLAR